MKLKMYPYKKCNWCGELSKNQPSGNICHTCSQGYMKEVEE